MTGPPAPAPKFRLFFPDGDWFRDEDGNTEFTARRAYAIDEALAGHVELERKPWPPPEPPRPDVDPRPPAGPNRY